jgi:hypothetical protein
MQNVTIEAQNYEGKLVSAKTEQMKLQAFLDSLPKGAKIECYYSVVLDPREKSLGQLAKVHVLIKQLANDTGNSVNVIKDEIKQRAGLIDVTTGEVKSFRDCSKTELNTAIQECINLGNDVGSYLH